MFYKESNFWIGQLKGPQLGHGQLQGPQLGQGQLQGPQIGRGQLQGPQLGRGQLQGPQLGRGQLQGPQLGRGQLKDPKLGPADSYKAGEAAATICWHKRNFIFTCHYLLPLSASEQISGSIFFF